MPTLRTRRKLLVPAWAALRFAHPTSTKKREAERRQTRVRSFRTLRARQRARRSTLHLSAFHRGILLGKPVSIPVQLQARLPGTRTCCRIENAGSRSSRNILRHAERSASRQVSVTHPALSQSRGTLGRSVSCRRHDAQSRPGVMCEITRGYRPRSRPRHAAAAGPFTSEIDRVCNGISDYCQ